MANASCGSASLFLVWLSQEACFPPHCQLRRTALRLAASIGSVCQLSHVWPSVAWVMVDVCGPPSSAFSSRMPIVRVSSTEEPIKRCKFSPRDSQGLIPRRWIAPSVHPRVVLNRRGVAVSIVSIRTVQGPVDPTQPHSLDGFQPPQICLHQRTQHCVL